MFTRPVLSIGRLQANGPIIVVLFKPVEKVREIDGAFTRMEVAAFAIGCEVG